jgi:MFS family permease
MSEAAEHPLEDEERGRLGLAFWRLRSASTLSNLADGLVKIALPLVAVTLTDSPGLVAGVTLAVTLPWLLFALPAGALADRVDRRIAMATANVVRAATVAALAVTLVLGLESSAAIWALYAVALLLGTAETVHDTSAQSILPQVVPRDRLPRANGHLIAAELTANEFVGPPLGGLLVAAGTAAAFATPAALWAAAVGVLLLLLRGSFAVPREESSTLRAEVAEGLRYLWRQRLLRTLAAMTGLFNFATNATFAVFVLYAVGPSSAMGLTGATFGLLFATLAAGNLIGALLADPIIRRLGRSRSLFLGILGGVGTVGISAQATGDRRRLPHRRPHQRALERRRRLAAATHHPRPHPRPDQQQLPARRLGHQAPGRRRRRPPRRAPRPARRLRHCRCAHPCHPARHDPGHRHRHQHRRTRPSQLTVTGQLGCRRAASSRGRGPALGLGLEVPKNTADALVQGLAAVAFEQTGRQPLPGLLRTGQGASSIAGLEPQLGAGRRPLSRRLHPWPPR